MVSFHTFQVKTYVPNHTCVRSDPTKEASAEWIASKIESVLRENPGMKARGFDGCHLKGPFRGVLLAAIGLDGNNGLFPVAFVLLSQSAKSLGHFFENLSMLVGGFSVDKPWTFMSDRQKGLVETINEVAPHAINRSCARHIYANFRSQFAGTALKRYFWQAANRIVLHAALGISHRREDLDSYCDRHNKRTCPNIQVQNSGRDSDLHVPLSKLARKRKTPPLAGRKRKAAVISSSQPPAPAQVSSSQPLPKKDPVVPSMHAAGSSYSRNHPHILSNIYHQAFGEGIGVSPHREIRSKKHNDAKGANDDKTAVNSDWCITFYNDVFWKFRNTLLVVLKLMIFRKICVINSLCR
ncbi:UNVERIFIED_CONTAM: hypothetical protein Sradi_0907900 [Sesamum radiatum]|uniref:MULE transposase domain-containing protein n=1 Tax=Sesamum radiatum TaxID=300843 RepID=A0AAW2V809_SESRA